jgi:hypothetical protein
MLLLAAMRGLVSQVSMTYPNGTQLMIRTIRADKETGGIEIRSRKIGGNVQ